MTGALGGALGGLSNLKSVASTALGTLTGNLITGAIQKIGELGRAIGDTLFNEAPALDQVRRSFVNLAASAGASADEVLASMREASNGMVTDANLMTSYNEAMLLVGDSMATKFPALLQIAQASAAATGQDVGFMLDSLVKGIGRASPMILDNLGLTINQAEAYQAYASSLGITTDEMTKAMQQEALLNAVIGQGGEFIERLGDNTGGTAQSLAQLKVALENTKDGITAELLPALGALLVPLAGLAQEYGPALVAWAGEFGTWLADYLPTAIAQLQTLWETAWPLIQAAIETVWPVVQAIFQQVAGWLQNEGPGALEMLRGIWESVWTAVQTFIYTILPPIIAFVTEQIGVIVAWVQANMPLIQETIQVVMARIQAVWETVWPAIQLFVAAIWAVIKGIVDAAVQAVLGFITLAMQIAQGDWEGAWTTIKETAASIWEAIKGAASEFLATVLGFIGSSTDEFVSTWKTNFELLKTITSTILDSVKSFIGSFSLRDVGANLIRGMIDGVKSMAGALLGAARGVVQGAVDAAKRLLGISSPSKVFAEIGQNVSLGMAEGIAAMAAMPARMAGDMVRGATYAGMTDSRDQSVTIYGGLHVREANSGASLLAQVAALGT